VNATAANAYAVRVLIVGAASNGPILACDLANDTGAPDTPEVNEIKTKPSTVRKSFRVVYAGDVVESKTRVPNEGIPGNQRSREGRLAAISPSTITGRVQDIWALVKISGGIR